MGKHKGDKEKKEKKRSKKEKRRNSDKEGEVDRRERGKTPVRTKTMLSCSACLKGPGEVDNWGEYVQTKKGKEPSGDKCSPHRFAHEKLFQARLTWEQFCQHYRSSSEFRALVGLACTYNSEQITPHAVGKGGVNDYLLHYLQYKRGVQIVAEEELLNRVKKVGLKKLPRNMKRIPVVWKPVGKE